MAIILITAHRLRISETARVLLVELHHHCGETRIKPSEPGRNGHIPTEISDIHDGDRALSERWQRVFDVTQSFR